MWNLPEPEIEPMSPALAGRLLSTGPQGSPPADFLCGWLAVFTLCRILLPSPACQHLKVLLTSRILPPAPTAAREAGRAVEALVHVCRETGVSEEARCSPLPLGSPWAGNIRINGTRYKRFYFSRKSKVQRGRGEGSWAWQNCGGQALGLDRGRRRRPPSPCPREPTLPPETGIQGAGWGLVWALGTRLKGVQVSGLLEEPRGPLAIRAWLRCHVLLSA